MRGIIAADADADEAVRLRIRVRGLTMTIIIIARGMDRFSNWSVVTNATRASVGAAVNVGGTIRVQVAGESVGEQIIIQLLLIGRCQGAVATEAVIGIATREKVVTGPRERGRNEELLT